MGASAATGVAAGAAPGAAPGAAADAALPAGGATADAPAADAVTAFDYFRGGEVGSAGTVELPIT